MNGPVIRGERLALRPLELADSALVVRWRNRPDVRRNIFNQPKLTLAAQRAWHRRYVADERQVRFIVDSHELGPIGSFGLTDLRPLEASAQLAVMLGEPAARGRGLAREALELLLEYGFEKWKLAPGRRGLNRVTAEVFDFNEPAVALYRKVGFRAEGRLRQAHWDARERRYCDVLVMGLLREEWRKKR